MTPLFRAFALLFGLATALPAQAPRVTKDAAPATSAELAALTRADTSAPLPFDPKVRAGVLPNGLHYYVRANGRPEHRAQLRLAINAGAVLEDPDQRGMAHFVEHMLFNGT